MKKVATLGEILLRLATPNKERILQAKNFDADYGGGEYNVAVSLSQFGVPTKFITALPDNAVGDAALNRIRSFGIDASSIVREGERMGLYFCLWARRIKLGRRRSAACFLEICLNAP